MVARMPGSIARRRLALLPATGILAASAGPASADWQAPVPGPVVGRFSVGPDPFAAGQRRGLDLAAGPGQPAVAPCGGRVSFAGAVPRQGGTVAIRCGRLTATVLGLDPASLAVVATDHVAAGAGIGAVGAGGRVRLGARRTHDRFGYVDPESLLGAAAVAPRIVPLGRRRLGRGPRTRRPGRARPPGAEPPPGIAPAMDPAPSRAPAAPAVSPAAWAGLALLAIALPAGGVVARRADRRRAAAMRRRATAARAAR
jgi:hypothetical protein